MPSIPGSSATENRWIHYNFTPLVAKRRTDGHQPPRCSSTIGYCALSTCQSELLPIS